MDYPKTMPVMLLCNSITATTTVTISAGMKVATIQFNSAATLLGTVVLSPVQPTAKQLEFKAGNQSLLIDEIYFQAAFGFTLGEVTCKGSATDQDGKNPVTFQKQIATWEGE